VSTQAPPLVVADLPSLSREATGTLSWPLWCGVASALVVEVGVHWDIAWHRSVGRDTFWSPPHVLIYLAAVLAATAALAQILPATFGSAGRDSAVRVLGFRGPLGAFISAWGGVAMLASAPFDDWWHNAYGLDVKILSPPHMVLALGIFCLQLGALIMLVGAGNRSRSYRALPGLSLLVIALMLVALLTVFMEKTLRVFMHGAGFYQVVAVTGPLLLVMGREATGTRWAATRIAGLYSAFQLALLWILPLVPAQPKLGPVLVPTTHLVPPEFPLLVLPAALVLDLFLDWQRRRTGRTTAAMAALAGALFLVVFAACQWPFADFLMSPPARNYLWGARYFDFWLPPHFLYRRYLFFPEDPAALPPGLALAAIEAAGSAVVGAAFGRWLARVRR
jgi:hypothetical protein